MKTLKAVIIAGVALTVSSPVLAGRYEDEIMRQDRAAKQLRIDRQGLAGPVGERGRMGPGSNERARSSALGHPSERVRR